MSSYGPAIWNSRLAAFLELAVVDGPDLYEHLTGTFVEGIGRWRPSEDLNQLYLVVDRIEALPDDWRLMGCKGDVLSLHGYEYSFIDTARPKVLSVGKAESRLLAIYNAVCAAVEKLEEEGDGS